MAQLSANRVYIWSDLLRLGPAPRRCVADYIQRARPRARRCPLVVGLRAQAHMLREAGPDGLRFSASPRRSATRHPLDVHRTQVMVHRMLLSDGSYGLSAPVEAAASPEYTGCPRLRVPTWVAQYACGVDDEQDRAVFRESGWNRPIKIPASWFRRRALPSPFLLKSCFIYRISCLLFIF